MKNYKLTETEARALATKLAKEFNQITNPNTDLDKWAENYMRKFNEIMNSLSKYIE